MEMNIGFIGTGTMGMPMAANILKAGFPLSIFARNPGKVKELLDNGALLADSASRLAEVCDIILLSLPFDPEVKEVVTGEKGILGRTGREVLVVDTTTGTPGNAIEMARLLRSAGMDYIDAPVSGGVKGAVEGALTFIAGGSEEAVEKATPVLKTMGSNIFRVGEAGTGMTLKALNQIISAMNTLTLCESVALGKKLGVSPSKFYEVLSHCAANSYHLQSKLPNFIIPGRFDTGHRIEMMIKDLRIALQIASDNGVPMPVSTMGTDLYTAASEGGFAGKDISAMSVYLENLTEK